MRRTVETINRKVNGIPKSLNFQLRSGECIMDANFDINEWVAYDSEGKYVCCASTKEELIKKVIRIAQGKEERQTLKEKIRW